MAEDNQSSHSGGAAGPERWERDVLREVALEAIKEQRRRRRWGIGFRLAFLVLFVILVVALIPTEVPLGPHAALVEIRGVMAPNSYASADNVTSALRAAFKEKRVKGVILRANSPGGSAVQAAYINQEIRRLRKKRPSLRVYAVVEDVCASACYYAIASVDKIYANENSLVGSIGVLYDGFGYTGLMEKVGVERRLLTAGENKGGLDPFSPLDEEAAAHMKKVLGQVHAQFIETVKRGRGDRLKDDAAIFSGLYWTGARGQELGLVDDMASAGTVAREVIGAEEIIDYTPQPSIAERITRGLGASMVEQFFKSRRSAVPLR